MSGFDTFLATLRPKLVALVTQTVRDRKDAAVKDVESFLEGSRADLERWSRLVALGELSPDEFEWLVKARVDLARIAALEQAGLAKVALDRFKQSLLDIVTGSALAALK